MSDSPTPELEKQLRELTQWRGPKTALWKDALSAARGPARARTVRWGRWLSVLGITSAAAVIVVAFALPSFFGAGQRAKHAFGDWRGTDPQDKAAEWSERYALNFTEERVPVVGDNVRGDFVSRHRAELKAPSAPAPTLGVPLQSAGRPLSRSAIEEVDESSAVARAGGAGSAATDAAERFVVRKATIELASDDVRATFAKASHLISEALGEFIQDSSVTGDSGSRLQANLTLRVSAERLSEVLNALRELGTVRGESAGGEDVTTQVVDLEARLRNERRVEAELLELLEKRADAPLKEVLELRQSLSTVRGAIEQMTGQREKLGRLVSLATVVVIIRAADAPPATQPGLGTYLNHVLRNALRDSARFLADSLAMLINVVVGGLVWWVLLIATILAIRSFIRSPGRLQASTDK